MQSTMKNVSAEDVAYEVILESMMPNREKEVQRREDENQGKMITLRLTPEEAKRAFEYQKAMLTFAWLQLKKAIGTPEEHSMQIMYNDSLDDYNTFLSEYEKELNS